MQHTDIERDCLIDRYVRNTLPVAERQAFEEHFLDCPQCLEQLEIASSLRQALREAPMATVPTARPASRSSWFVWNWVQVLALACLVATVATSVVFFRQLQTARIELASARSDAEQLRSAANSPMMYVLSQNRGSAAAKQIALPREARWMVFSVEMDTTQFPSYRAVLKDSTGKQVWAQGGIPPSSPDTLAVAVPSRTLSPGIYSLTVGTPDGSTLGRFPLEFK